MTTQVPENLESPDGRWWFEIGPTLPRHKRVIANPLWRGRTSSQGDVAIRSFVHAHNSIGESREELDGIISGAYEGWPYITTACHRMYVGTWAIEDGKLYLTRLSMLQGRVLDRPEPLFADWVSGTLLAIRAKSVDWAGYDVSQHPHRMIEVRRGRVLLEKDLEGSAATALISRLSNEKMVAWGRRRKVTFWAKWLLTGLVVVMGIALCVWLWRVSQVA